jgi:surface polysaccharide O-acyltransferase-like enzyme
LLLLFIPLIAIAPLEIYSKRLLGGWDFLPYLLFIICGYLFFTNEQIKESLKRYCIASFAIALLLTVIYLLIEFSSVMPEISSYMLMNFNDLSSSSPPDLTWPLTGFFVLRHLAACFWMIAILGLAGRFLNFSNRFLGYASEAILPFYILHMTIVYLIGFFVIQWTVGMTIKYIIIALASFIITVLIYEFLVRRINVLRVLFGMKIKY